MSRCIKMTFALKRSDEKLFESIQKQARSCNLEGCIMASSPESVKLIACGTSSDLDNFLDHVDEIIAQQNGEHVEIDPFLKDKDYRGVFRIML
jgi:acylphosphatase